MSKLEPKFKEIGMFKKVGCALLMLVSSQVFAVDEVLEVQTSGTEYCGTTAIKFNPNTDMQLFFYVVDSATWQAYDVGGNLVATLDVQLNMIGTSTTRASFNAFSGDAADHISVSGQATFDAYTKIKQISGSFTRRGLTNGCYSSGKLTAKYIGLSITP
jgi:hypothetical protein